MALTAPRPDILLVVASDLGRWLAPYGYPVPAPNLAALAARSHLFRQAFAAAPVGDPALASLLTGTYPLAHGLIGPACRGFSSARAEWHLAGWLAGLGYETFRMATAAAEDRLPFQEVHQVFRRCSDDEEVCRHAAEQLSRSSGAPRYIEVTLRGGLRPFPDVPGTSANMPPPPIPNTPETRADMAGFIESVRRLDAALGPLLGAAESAANPHGVLTLFTTGNGPAFPLMKGTLRDEGLRVAMMFAVPHLQRPTGVYDTAVAHLDIFPTLCEFLGEPAPPWLQGRSLAPLMRGEAVAVSDRIFAQMDFYACADPARCIRSAKFKLIRFFSGDSRLALANMDDSPSKTAALPLALRGWQRPKEQLFDLAADPREFRNLAALPDFQEVRLQLAAELEVWMKAQSDPLCQGVQPVPSGVELVPRDWESAQAPLCGVG